ncbi:hypothetical protein HDU96_007994 [Phlyctochytrium bullatum]|nr:hypothetical protein HDU96_007994 [Phlyctochytrium bullatum]
MVQHIEQIAPASAAVMASAITEIQNNWPAIKAALEAKKGVDDAFANAIKHETAAFDINKEMWKLTTSPQKKKKIAELKEKMGNEFRAAAKLEAQAVDLNQKFLENRPAFDTLETHIAAYLAQVRLAAEGSEFLRSRLDKIAAARKRYDVAKARLPRFSKAETLVKEILEHARNTRQKLIEEYSGDGYERCPFPNDMLGMSVAYLDPKTQRDAVNKSDAVAIKTQTVFELCPELPPHTIQPANLIDPDGPASNSRRRTAIVTQNAVKRLDAVEANNEITLRHLQKELEVYRRDVLVDAETVRKVSAEVWEATVGKEAGDVVREWVPEIALSTRAFRLEA